MMSAVIIDIPAEFLTGRSTGSTTCCPGSMVRSSEQRVGRSHSADLMRPFNPFVWNLRRCYVARSLSPSSAQGRPELAQLRCIKIWSDIRKHRARHLSSLSLSRRRRAGVCFELHFVSDPLPLLARPPVEIITLCNLRGRHAWLAGFGDNTLLESLAPSTTCCLRSSALPVRPTAKSIWFPKKHPRRDVARWGMVLK